MSIYEPWRRTHANAAALEAARQQNDAHPLPRLPLPLRVAVAATALKVLLHRTVMVSESVATTSSE